MYSDDQVLEKILGSYKIKADKNRVNDLLEEIALFKLERKAISNKIAFAKAEIFHIEANKIADIMEKERLTVFFDISIPAFDKIVRKLRRM